MSRHRLPREQAAIERHFDRQAAPVFEKPFVTPSAAKPGWNDSTLIDRTDEAAKVERVSEEREAELDAWVRAAPTPEERAKRAREVAEKKHNAKAAEKAAQLKCFKGPLKRAAGASTCSGVHERLYQDKDDRRRRLEEARMQHMDQEEEKIAEAKRAASPSRTATSSRAASPSRATSPGRGCSSPANKTD